MFNRESEIIQPLRALVETSTHRALVLWALECTRRFLKIYEERVPGDDRPSCAYERAVAWAAGAIKIGEGRQAILSAHRAAREAEADPIAWAAARAVGQGLSTIHVETHALGMVFYGLTCLIHLDQTGDPAAVADKEIAWFYEALEKINDAPEDPNRPWAAFLLKDRPNKERLLREKTERRRESSELAGKL